MLLILACVAFPARAQEMDNATNAEPGLHPKPSIVSPSWSLDLELQTPRTIAARDFSGSLRWYWYLPYTLTNHTGEDRLYTPQVTVTDNLGQIIQVGREIPPTVYPAVKSRLRNPLLESPEQVVGKILQGEDFARDSVFIWPVSEKDVDEFTIFISGADGETQVLVSPVTGEPVMQPAIDPLTEEPIMDESGKPTLAPVLVRRTRVLTYANPGTHGSPQFYNAELTETSVVMR